MEVIQRKLAETVVEPDEPKKKSLIPTMHKSQKSSLLASSRSGYRGFINLAVLLLVMANFRLLIINILKYGVLIDITPLVLLLDSVAFTIIVALNFNVIIAYFLEILAISRILNEKIVVLLQSFNLIALVVVPSYAIWIFKPLPFMGVIVELWICMFFLKLTSYAHVNWLLRQEYFSSNPPKMNSGGAEMFNSYDVLYPLNLSLGDLYLFLCFPTLCYQLSYPRTPGIRIGYLLKRTIEAALLAMLVLVLAEQYYLPGVQNSLEHLKSLDFPHIVQRLLKIAVPNLYIWLIGFYVYFHCFLNIVAELTRFGDREFYKDWWNSTTLEYFWKNWNIPVHNWMFRHLYIPLSNRGISRNIAFIICFTFSGFWHEIIVGVPFGVLNLWCFFGMIGNLPLIVLTRPLDGHQAGNVIFWLMITLGQPFIVFMYYLTVISEETL